MISVVAYIRSTDDTAGSRTAVEDQRIRLRSWLEQRPAVLLQEFVETERVGDPRPELAAAIALCQAADASLIICSAEPIGNGEAFHPRVRSVPVIILPRPFRSPPQVIPCPADCPEKLCLYVTTWRTGGLHDEERLLLYLCNPTPLALFNGQVQAISWFLRLGSLTASEPTSRNFDFLVAGACQLLESRSPFTEADTIDQYRIRFTTAAGEQVVSATIRQFVDKRFVALCPPRVRAGLL